MCLSCHVYILYSLGNNSVQSKLVAHELIKQTTSAMISKCHKKVLMLGTIVCLRMCSKRRGTGVSNHKRTETRREETLSLICALLC